MREKTRAKVVIKQQMQHNSVVVEEKGKQQQQQRRKKISAKTIPISPLYWLVIKIYDLKEKRLRYSDRYIS